MLTAAPLLRSGAPRLDADVLENTFAVASVDGLFFDQDRLAVTEGRMANPDRPDEIVMTAVAAHLLGFHVGQVIPYGFYTQQQEGLPGFGTAKVPPHRRIDAKLVGLVQLNNAIVQDDIDRLPTFIFFTPALGQEVVADGGQVEGGAITYGLQVDGGNAGVATVEREFAAPGPDRHHLRRSTPSLPSRPRWTGRSSRSPSPWACSEWSPPWPRCSSGFRSSPANCTPPRKTSSVLRALGAGPATTVADGLIGIVGADHGGRAAGRRRGRGSVTAVTARAGPVPCIPDRASPSTGRCSASGSLVLIVGLGAIAVALAYRGAPHRVARRAGARRPGLEGRARRWPRRDCPPPAAVGVRFALESGRGRTAVPVRSALLGAVLAVALVVATLTFGSGLQSLVSHPALYGWNWTYMLNPTNNVPPQAATLLDHDHDVAAWAGYDYNDAEIDGQNVPFLFEGHPVRQVGSDQPADPDAGTGSTARTRSSSGRPRWRSCTSTSAAPSTVTYGHPKDAPFYIPPHQASRRRGHRHACPQSGSRASSPITPPWAPARSSVGASCPVRSNRPSRAPTPRSTDRTWSSSGSGPASPAPPASPACKRIATAAEPRPRRRSQRRRPGQQRLGGRACSARPRSSTTGPWASPRRCSPPLSPPVR